MLFGGYGCVILGKRVARGVSGGSDEPPTLQKRSAKFARYICIVHVGDDDLARSGVYVRTCRQPRGATASACTKVSLFCSYLATSSMQLAR